MIRQFKFLDIDGGGSFLRVEESDIPDTVRVVAARGDKRMEIDISKDDAKDLSTVLDGRYSSYGESIRYQSDPDVLDEDEPST